MRNKLLTDLLFGMGLTMTQSQIDDIEHAALAGSWIPEREGNPNNYYEVEVVQRIVRGPKNTFTSISRVNMANSSFDETVTHWRPIVWPEEGGKV